MIDARNLSALAPIVFGATGKIGLLTQVPDLLRRLGVALRASGANVQSFLDLFGGETAVALASGSGSPALVIVTRTSNEQAARADPGRPRARAGPAVQPGRLGRRPGARDERRSRWAG